MLTTSSKLYLLLLIIKASIILCSCQQSYDNQKYTIDLSKLTETSVFDIFEDVHIVPLETGNDELIGIISKVIYFNNAYFIRDGRSKTIWCFDDKGNYLYTISAQGRGPGEFINLTDFTIDRDNERLFILDAPMSRVLSYDLKGEYLKDWVINTDKSMGFSRIYCLSDSMLLITSITNEQLVFFNISKKMVVHKKFPQDVFLQALIPRNNVYQFDNRTFALPALSQQVYDVTHTKATPHFKWNFGNNNNTERDIENVINEINKRDNPRSYFLTAYELVGKNRPLHHHIEKVYETIRYNIALVEFDNNWRHIILDKHTDQAYIFNHFEELVSLSFASLQEDRVISFDSGVKDRIRSRGPLEWQHRIVDSFNSSVLSESDQKIIENHDPMTDNPFLVVYKFKK